MTTENIEESVIPPSPNWYLSNAFECHKNSGVLAYAASRCLVFIWPIQCDKDIRFPQTRVVPDAHRNKITCVSWCQSSEQNSLLVSSAGEDGRVCVWKANDQTMLLEHDTHKSQKISCLSWSPFTEKKILASSSDDGVIVITELLLNYESFATRILNFGKINPTTLSFSPHTNFLIAVGCKGGLLYICDTRDNRGVLHKLRAHEEDVHNVVWCPVKGNKLLRENDTNETFIATSGRDKTIKIWAVGDGKCITQAKLPGNTGIHRPRSGQQDDKRSTWVALHWLNEQHILSSGMSGELLSWDVGQKLTWKIIHKLHNRGLFNISSYVAEDNKEMVWTSAQDRNVILWPFMENHTPKEVLGIAEMENPWLCVPTIGGFVYCLAANPIDSSHMALGLGDCSIRIWNMAAGKPEVTMLWNGIKGKVTGLSWHPTIEGRLAFGTDEGRVGIFDTLNLTKPPLLSRTYHKGTVYNLAWATLPGKEGLFLYSCGGSQICIHDPSSLEAEARNFNQLIGGKGQKKAEKFPSRTDFQWKTDYTLLAIGNEDGSVEIYCGLNFSLLTIIVAHKKLIQCLKWHPTFTFESSESSKLSSWLAVASNDTSIKVFNVIATEGEPATSSLVCTLSGHKERVVSVAWNPYSDGILLSASYDGTAQVWDVKEKKPAANFGGHGGRVLCCEWDSSESGTAITGSDDLTLRKWRVKDQIYSTAAETLAAAATKTDKKKTAVKSISIVTNRQSASSTSGKKKPTGKLKSLFPVSASLEARGRPDGLNDCKIVATLKGIPLKHSVCDEDPKSYTFPADEFGQDQLVHLGFFCDRNAALQMLEEEIEHHEESSSFELAAHLRIWQGDVESLLKESVKKKRLNEWLVSLAPQVSLEFWREMCQMYSQQLLAEGDVRKAASYALISGQKSQAVDIFSSHQLHRESMALTRCLYPDGSSQVRESLSLCSGKAIQDGNLELAVKCLLANDDVTEAARVLARRSDPASLKLSADFASFAGLDQLAAAYLHQAAENLEIITEKIAALNTQQEETATAVENEVVNSRAGVAADNSIQQLGQEASAENANHLEKITSEDLEDGKFSSDQQTPGSEEVDQSIVTTKEVTGLDC